jgi:hypothetical protein
MRSISNYERRLCKPTLSSRTQRLTTTTALVAPSGHGCLGVWGMIRDSDHDRAVELIALQHAMPLPLAADSAPPATPHPKSTTVPQMQFSCHPLRPRPLCALHRSSKWAVRSMHPAAQPLARSTLLRNCLPLAPRLILLSTPMSTRLPIGAATTRPILRACPTQ